jgi:hypothetical protein
MSQPSKLKPMNKVQHYSLLALSIIFFAIGAQAQTMISSISHDFSVTDLNGVKKQILRDVQDLPNGTTAPNFTFTDMNGVKQDLYTYLNAGMAVVIDVSATWCGPCWNYHKSGNLENFYKQEGPSGTNRVQVIFIEGDPNTNDACMTNSSGCKGGTNGNWVSGTPYPMCNPSSAQTNAFNSTYKIAGYPTMYLICPNKKTKNVGQYTTAQLTSALKSSCTALGTNDADINNYISVYPNPSSGNVIVDINSGGLSEASVRVINLLGEIISETIMHESIDSQIKFDLSAQPNGMYFIEVRSTNSLIVQKVLFEK